MPASPPVTSGFTDEEERQVLEVLVAATATTGLFALARHAREQPFVIDPRLVVDLREDRDLPCPWCRSSTSEADERCPSCGHRFG